MKNQEPKPIETTFSKMTTRALDLAYKCQDDGEVKDKMFAEIQRRVNEEA